MHGSFKSFLFDLHNCKLSVKKNVLQQQLSDPKTVSLAVSKTQE